MPGSIIGLEGLRLSIFVRFPAANSIVIRIRLRLELYAKVLRQTDHIEDYNLYRKPQSYET